MSIARQPQRMLEEGGRVVRRVALFAVHSHIVELGRPTQDALSLSLHALDYALPVVDVPALQLQRGVPVQTNAAHVSKVELLVLLPHQLRLCYLLFQPRLCQV